MNHYIHKSTSTLSKNKSYMLRYSESIEASLINFITSEFIINENNYDELLVVVSDVLDFKTQSKNADINFLLYPDGYIWGYSELLRYGSALENFPCLNGKVERVGNHLVSRNDDYLAFLQKNARKNMSHVNMVSENFYDQKSRSDYLNLINTNVDDLSKKYLENLFSNVQYFEYILYQEDMTIINAGVDEGFELIYFDALTNHTCQVYNIDPSGFGNLSPVNKSVISSDNSGRFVEVKYVLWSKCGRVDVPVSENGAVLSQYYDNNIHNIDVHRFNAITVDSLVDEHQLEQVDLIKMDIEGAEPYALEGAMNTITKMRPQLAISIYHWPNHYWEIPMLLMDKLDDYRFYFGHYSPGRWESIIYAIPNERVNEP